MTPRRRRSRTTSLLGPLLAYIVLRLLGAPAPETFAFLFAYFVLYDLGLHYANIWSENNPHEPHLLNVEGFDFRRGVKQIAFGVTLMMVIAFLVILIARPGLQPSTAAGKFQAFGDQVLVVAPVEEFLFRWILPTVWAGSSRHPNAAVARRRNRALAVAAAVASQILFAVLHPIIRTNWFAGQFPLGSILFFAYAFSVGMFFLAVLRYGPRVSPSWLRPYIGFGTLVGWHGGINAIGIVWVLQALGMPFAPLGG